MEAIQIKNIRIEEFAVGDLGANCYFLINMDTKAMTVIDPGGNGSQLIRRIWDHGWQPESILLTHGHCDHAHHAKMLAGEFHIPIWAHEIEREILSDPVANASSLFGYPEYYMSDRSFKDGDILKFAGMEIEVLWTPGHTAGGVCFLMKEYKILFSSDTLFCGSVGRTDLKSGSEKALQKSIREKLMVLPDDIQVLPGHMIHTTIGNERKRFR